MNRAHSRHDEAFPSRRKSAGGGHSFYAREMKELESAVAAIPVMGSRYNAEQEAKVQK